MEWIVSISNETNVNMIFKKFKLTYIYLDISILNKIKTILVKKIVIYIHLKGVF